MKIISEIACLWNVTFLCNWLYCFSNLQGMAPLLLPFVACKILPLVYLTGIKLILLLLLLLFRSFETIALDINVVKFTSVTHQSVSSSLLTINLHAQRIRHFSSISLII